ncbi:response regulator [Candidatus Peregrinibacteria bacterium]|nr:response regulator [Candidatus Peregrinibacteria bacterium]
MEKFLNKVLIAEDNLYLSKAMRSFLADEGLDIDVANDGNQASALINKNEYRLIFLDLNMPFKSGFDILAELKAKKDPPPVLVFSNFDQPESKELALSLGAREYFVKHKVDLDDLRNIIKIYLKGKIK